MKGCGSCEILKALLDGLFLAYPDLVAEDSMLKWIGYYFALQIMNSKKDRQLDLQFFSPSGKFPRVVKYSVS